MSEVTKLLTLAKAARGRIDAEQGAAILDDMGRSYAAPDITQGELRLSALELAVAQSVAAGARGIAEAVMVQRDGDVDPGDLRALLGVGVPVQVYAPDGVLIAEIAT
jgi:hypothetical protein